MALIRHATQAVLLATLLAGLCASAGYAQSRTGSILDDPRVRALGREGLDHLYNMETDKANAAFARIEALYPDHPVGPFLRGLNVWWDIMVDFSTTVHDEAFFKEMDIVLERSNRMLKRNRNDFDAIFFKGAAHGFSGRLRSNRGQWMKAALDGKSALDYVMAIAEKDPSEADYVFGKGIYDYFSVIIPRQYPSVRPFTVFMPKGNVERGIAQLTRTMNEGHFIRTEAAYFLLQIYYAYEEDYAKSLEHVQWLRTQHPKNSLFHAFEGRVYVRWGRWRQAAAIFEDVIQRYDARQNGYNDAIAEQAFYYLGRSQMASRDYEAARASFERLERILDRDATPSGFKVLGYLRLGMVHDALQNRSRAQAYYRQVLKLEDWSGAHDRAEDYLKKPYRG
jgi:tetratricopeptide (TPR) repeat protein